MLRRLSILLLTELLLIGAVNAQDRLNVAWLGRIPLINAWDVALSDSFAYVADDMHGLRIMDICDPAAPMEVGRCDIPGFGFSVAASGSYAYVAAAFSGLRIIDVSNPTSPIEVGHYSTPASAWGVAVSGSYAYVTDGDTRSLSAER